jgi:uncharacterized membrane protein
MEQRPRIQPTLTPVDRVVEWIGWLALILLWGFTLWNYSALPESIATHFNATGHADAYGSKSSIFILPIIGSVIFIGLSFLNRYPYIFNYPTPITAENAGRQYANGTRLIRYLKSLLVIVFGFILQVTMRTAATHSEGLGILFFPITLGVMFVLLIIFIVRAMRLK